jgi:hypothetical protein
MAMASMKGNITSPKTHTAARKVTLAAVQYFN